MIEFKRAGDVMVFECPAFKIEVAGNSSERIELNRDAINSQSDSLERISDAFEILGMMIEHKARQTHVLHFGVDVAKGEDAAEVIRKLNEYVWKHVPSENPTRHGFREFMKREGL